MCTIKTRIRRGGGGGFRVLNIVLSAATVLFDERVAKSKMFSLLMLLLFSVLCMAKNERLFDIHKFENMTEEKRFLLDIRDN